MRTDLPPGPSWPTAVQGAAFWSRPLPFLERCRKRYGKRFTIRIPTAPPFVMLSDPADIKAVYTAGPDELHPGAGARVLEPIVGTYSVILLDGDAHMSQRKLLLPAFHGEKMNRLTGLIEEVTEREVASWPADEPFELHPRLQALTLEIVLRAIFGLDADERLGALRERMALLLAFGDQPWSLIVPAKDGRADKVLRRLPPFSHFLAIQAEADELIFGLIDERRRETGEGRDDILSLLLEARHDDDTPMSDQELRDELMTLLVAGHETTASSLAWAFAQLTRLPRVMDELTAAVRSDDGDEYLPATIYEGMRRRPVLPNTAPRLVVDGFDLGDRTIPAGVCLVPNGYLVHHDPEIYPDPYEFRPERFLAESPGTYTWIPFGGGRRRCLGASFAILEMKVVLQAVLRAWEMQPAGAGPERARRRNITISPARGATVTLRPSARTASGPQDREPALSS